MPMHGYINEITKLPISKDVINLVVEHDRAIVDEILVSTFAFVEADCDSSSDRYTRFVV